MSRKSPNPFIDDVFVDLAENLPGVVEMHQQAFSEVVEAIETAAGLNSKESPFANAGRSILVTAPRAGYGKSHLVARMRDEVSHLATTLVLPFQSAQSVTWSVTLDSFVAQSTADPNGDDQLAEVGRHFLAMMVQSAINSGTINREHFPTDPARLEDDYADLFSREGSGNLIDWTNERCDQLAHSFGSENSPSAEARGADACFWARLFLDRELGDLHAVERLTGLPESEARGRCLQFLRISASLRPVMLIVDGLDSFYATDDSSGMDIARIIAGVRDEVPRSLSVVCLNDEVWDSVFEGKLPSAYVDRLTGETSKLSPITPEVAEELVVHRLSRADVPASSARKFSDRLANSNQWFEAKTRLTPREVLRQARGLWTEIGEEYLEVPDAAPDDETGKIYEVPLSDLTDKADFFAELQEKGLPTGKKSQPSPAPAETETTESEPVEEEDTESAPINPFFAAPTFASPEQLDGIESIISDIRGSGSSVISEPAKEKDFAEARPIPTIQAGPIEMAPARNGNSSPSEAAPPKEEPSPPVTRQSIDKLIQEKHRELLDGPPLKLELAKLSSFLKAVGENHPGLAQSEEHLPGAQSVCLRWRVHGQSVLLGFESPQNVYFWNHLLQQSLSSNEREKISAFSHSSQTFDPELFATFGFSPAVIQGRIDPIDMSDEELALLYAADSVLGEFKDAPDAAMAMQHITQQLDPLWRRIGQAV